MTRLTARKAEFDVLKFARTKSSSKTAGSWTWVQLDSLFGGIVTEAFQKVRFCDPHPTDTNRARWSNAQIWDFD